MGRAPFGSWPSPVSAADLVDGAVAIGFPVQAGGRLLWQEARPEEAGRVTIVAVDLGGDLGSLATTGCPEEIEEVLPAQMSARTAVHEYGGLCWAAGGPGGRTVVSANHADQRLWLISPGAPRPLTPAPDLPGELRYAAPAISPDGAWVVAVRESHTGNEVRNDIVAVPLADGSGVAGEGAFDELRVVASGRDFYSWPTLSPNGRHLAYVAWDQPDMPWDATSLWVASFECGRTGVSQCAGGTGRSSIVQPKWAPATGAGSSGLMWASDETGWWSLYRDGELLAGEEVEFARPAWAFGDSDYACLPSGELMATWRSEGRSYLGSVRGGRPIPLDLPFTEFAQLCPYTGLGSEGVVAVAAGPADPPQLVAVSTSGQWSVLRHSRPAPQDSRNVSEGVHFRFDNEGAHACHAIFYAPHLGGWEGPRGELPPLLVTSHGGPTDQASTAYQSRTQFWTTRGFAVVDVDYRGSTGYGRAYRRALEGGWGVTDVDDCARAALWLGEHGWADPSRTLFRGASSSGLTVLAAMARYPWIRGGIARYPVCDMSQLSKGHKFESRYLERLVPVEQMAARSPLNFASQVQAPVLLMHGTEDRVVPCSSTVEMAVAVRASGGVPALVLLGGEGHGFRQAPNIVRSQMLELAFACKALDLHPAGDMGSAWEDLHQSRCDEGAFWPEPVPR